MCKMKSAIILKDRVFIPDYDSHTEMLEELKIEDTRANAERLFVRAELIPPRGDVFAPVDSWAFNVDQDILPEWFVEEIDRERMVEAVKGWAKDHIHIGVNGLKIDAGSNHYIKDSKDVEICGSATVNKVYGSATVNKVYGSATVNEVYGSATVNEVCGSATVNEVCGSATVKYVYGSATVNKVYGSATVNKVYGSATVNKVYGSATVNKVYGSATVNEVYGSATVNEVYGSATVNEVCGSATVIGSPYGWRNKGSLILSDNATFKDCQAKVIHQAGNWELRLVSGGESND